LEPQAITTIPLGTIIGLGVGLLVIGLAVGWYAAHSRWQRHQARHARQQAGQLQSILQALPLAALISDTEGRILGQNKEAAQFLTAFHRGDTVPLTVDAAVGRVIRTGQTESLELLRPGSEQPVHVLIAPIAGGETAVSQAIILFNHATAAPQQLHVYQQLVSAIGHELRTPLTAVMGHVDIIGSCTVEEETLWRRSLTFVTAEVERLARLVEDLLHLSRLDLAASYLRPTNLRLIAEEAISTLFDKAEAQNITLILQAANTMPRVQADPDRIRQVFLNLIDNAIKYAPDSTVTIQLTPQKQAVQVEVRDTGPGIPGDDLSRLFEPFHRGRQDEAIPGTGLGLTIVKSILDQHQAPIQVKSTINEGTRFIFSLPNAR
jgi:signal transduction histidine kinase